MLPVYGPQKFVRDKGKPKTVTDEFKLPAGVFPPFQLHISNGDGDKKNQIPSTTIYVNDQLIFDGPTNKWPKGQMIFEIDLEKGNTISVRSAGQPGNFLTIWITAAVDQTPPVLTISSPSRGAIFNADEVTVAGTIVDESRTTVTVNGVEATVTDNRAFSAVVPLTSDGEHVLTATATDAAGNSAEASVTVIRDSTPPVITLLSPDEGLITSDRTLTVTGRVTDLTPTLVDVNGASLPVDEAGNFSGDISLVEGLNELTITAIDSIGNTSSIFRAVTLGTLPPDPADVAPPIDQTVGTTIAMASAFLYTGDNPIQSGVAPGTINPLRAAVIRGRVLTRDGTPLPGVTLTILDHPELGQTLSRLDGMFDMAVNGGGALTVDYKKEDYLPAQRQVEAPWQDYVWLPDVVLIPLDTHVTAVDLSSGGPMQAARGSFISDTGGSRQATLLIPRGTQAELMLPGGGTQTLTGLSVRATEYTVGNTGPEAMPAELPPQSGYTYAVEYSVDQALAAGGTGVRFNQPLIHYVENFLDFPTGMPVPVGYYDREQAAWVPSDNGRVVKILSIANGLADLDTDGDGTADNGAMLGVTEAERQQLAVLHQAGQSLWRVPITHFTPLDCNWPYGPLPGARAAQQPPPRTGSPAADPCLKENSIIECENQILRESVGIVGTPFSLNYASDRVAGGKPANSLEVSLSGPTLPVGVKRIELGVQVAGQRFQLLFPAAPDQGYVFTWDGHDAYGRLLQGAAPIAVQIGYVYDAVYQEPAQLARSFAELSGVPLTGNRTRQEVTLWQEWQGEVGSWDARPQGLAAWSLDVHHVYDFGGKVLYLGNGERQSAHDVNLTISTVAGNGGRGYGGDGGPAIQAQFNNPLDVVVGPDGSLYIADSWNRRIRRVAPDGIITTVAGNGIQGYGGDGGPATQAQLSEPFRVAVGTDGSLYIADIYNHRIRRVGPDGIITTVAGNGTAGYSGDGGPATQARLNHPQGVVAGPDGSLYIADTFNHRIRRVGPGGIISTVAGNGLQGYGGDGGPAKQAQLNSPTSVALGPDGNLYWADAASRRIRRVGPDGIITTVAGNGTAGYSGDGGPATQAQLYSPDDVAVGPDGSLYIADTLVHRIRRVGPDGIISTAAGNGLQGHGGDGGPAKQAQVSPRGVAVGPDGNLYIADTFNYRIRSVASPLPGSSLADFVIPAEDGSELYVFDSQGRHLRTLGALTGAIYYEFGYDSAGRLARVADRDGLVTRIERDASGNPAAIVGPHGQRTTLRVDTEGYLASITSPAGQTTQLAYTSSGLLTRLTDPRGGVHDFTYDAAGRLTRDTNPAGGFISLARLNTSTGYTVTLRSAQGMTTQYRTETLSSGDQSQVNTFPTGSQVQAIIRRDDSRSATFPDGTGADLVVGPDPRWGMLAPILKSLEARTPGGLNYSVTATSQVTLSNPRDLFSVVTGTDSVNVNGRVYTRMLEVVGDLSRLTFTSPEGRRATITFDRDGRPVEFLRDPGVVPIAYSHDAAGRLERINAADQSLTYGYDALGRLASRTVADGSQTRYGYDGADRLTSTQLPSTLGYGFGYDKNGNRTEVVMPSGSQHGLAYTPADILASYTAPGAPAYRKAFGMDGELDRIDLAGGRTVDLTQDAFGRATGMLYPEATIRWGYADLTQRVTQLSRTPAGAAPQNLTLTYDGDLITSKAWSGLANGRIAYHYDNNFFLVGVRVDNEPELVVTNDRDGLPTGYGPFRFTRNGPSGATTQIGDGVLSQSYSYDNLGRIANRSQTVGGTSVCSMQITYNNLGQIKAKTETLGGVTVSYGYVYDADGQVIEVLRDGVVIERYAYDQNGNRISRQVGAGPVETASYDVQDRLLQQGTVSYEVDTDGYLVGRGQNTFQYSARGELLEAIVDGQSVSYGYDALHRRVSRSDAGGTYQFLYGDAYDDMRITAYRNPSGLLAHIFYDDAGLLYALRLDGSFYYIATDQVGSPRIVSDASGALVKRVEYDSFGNIVFDSNPDFNLPFGFAGGLLDRATGLLRFGWRDYDPLSGRWTARDPVWFEGGQLNLYSYVSNDPINHRDPSGLFSVTVSAYAGVGALVKISVTTEGISLCSGLGFGAGTSATANPTAGLDPTGAYTRIKATASYGPWGAGGELRLCTDGSSKFIPKFKGWPSFTGGEDVDLTKSPEKNPWQDKWGWGVSGDITGVVCARF